MNSLYKFMPFSQATKKQPAITGFRVHDWVVIPTEEEACKEQLEMIQDFEEEDRRQMKARVDRARKLLNMEWVLVDEPIETEAFV